MTGLPEYGDWKVVKRLGKGSFGSVYEIERHDFNVVTRAALKVISIPLDEASTDELRSQGMDDESVTTYYQSIAEEFIKEFELMARLRGLTNIVSYEDHVIERHTDGIGWDILIRMELLTPLNAYLATGNARVRDVIRLGIDICSALSRCHKLSIIHRDIKPGNIFVSEQGDFKLGDFGVARTAEHALTTMSRKGTPAYMAPEVNRGETYDFSVDIYSLGVVMYRLLNCNRAPFMPPYPEKIRYQDQEEATVRRMRGDAFTPPVEASPELAAVVLKACAFKPEDRYESPETMAADLRALLNSAEYGMLLGSSVATVAAGSTAAPKATVVEEVESAANDDAPSAGTGVGAADEATLYASDASVAPVQSEATVIDTGVSAPAVEATVIDNVALGAEATIWESGSLDMSAQSMSESVQCSASPYEGSFDSGGYAASEDDVEGMRRPEGGADDTQYSRHPEQVAEGTQYSRHPERSEAESRDLSSTDNSTRTGNIDWRALRLSCLLVIVIVIVGALAFSCAGGQGGGGSSGSTSTEQAAQSAEPTVEELESSLIGMKEDEAVQTLEDAGYEADISNEYSEKVDEGLVVSAEFNGLLVAGHKTFNVVVSKGSSMVKMPNLKGKSKNAAKKALKKAGLKLGKTTKKYSSKKKGTVISQSVKKSKKVKIGSKVNIVLSKGSRPVTTTSSYDDYDDYDYSDYSSSSSSSGSSSSLDSWADVSLDDMEQV